jgi:hypothetical protein
MATTFAVSNTCSTDDESRRLEHCRLSFFAIFATFCSHVFSGSIAIPGPPYRIQRLPLAAGFLPSADCSTAIKSDPGSDPVSGFQGLLFAYRNRLPDPLNEDDRLAE